MTMAELNPLEKAVLGKLFEGNGPVLAALRHQTEIAKVDERRMTGMGFYTTFNIPEGEPPAPVRLGRMCFGDVVAKIPGLEEPGLDYGAGFLVCIQDGRLQMLEGYSYQEPWPEVVSTFELFYLREHRDWDELEITGG
jgi:hypothetical protein